MKTTPEAIRDLTAVVGGSAPPVTLSTIEALRQLYAALGGAEDVSKTNTIPGMLEVIAAAQAAAVDYAAIVKGIAERDIETLVFPEGTESVADGQSNYGDYFGTFGSITTLEKVVFPESLTYIGNGAFKGCSSLEEVVFAEGLTTIATKAFQGCTSITELNFPKTLKTIKSNAFYQCTALKSADIAYVETIENSAFNGCTTLESVDLTNLVTIGNQAFYGCTELKSVRLGNKLTGIGSSNFYNTNIVELTIPGSVSNVGSGVFFGCKALVTATYGEGVVSIAGKTQSTPGQIEGCTAIDSLYLPSTIETIGDNAFSNPSATLTIYCAFSENAVSGAPWGATNATIVYDHTPSE